MTDTTREGVSRRTFLKYAGGAVAAGGVLTGGTYLALSQGPASELVSHALTGPVPGDNPDAGEWDVRPFDVALTPQNITTPMLAEASVDVVRVRSLHDGSHIAFLLEWADSAADEIEAVGRFRDAVAVQLPIGADSQASFTMGGVGAPVHIVHWKASWQADVDRGQQTVRDAYPNGFNDWIPEELMDPELARVFYPGLAVGNPLSAVGKASPVEELIAEGFGTLTHQAEQRATGRGVFDDGRWRVAVQIPMAGGDKTASLTPGMVTQVGFAVWNGEKHNRGARKHYAPWVPLTVEATA